MQDNRNLVGMDLVKRFLAFSMKTLLNKVSNKLVLQQDCNS